MQYYSTNKQAPDVTLEEAVVKGLAADKGLFMPFTIKPLPQEFYDSIDTLGFQELIGWRMLSLGKMFPQIH